MTCRSTKDIQDKRLNCRIKPLRVRVIQWGGLQTETPYQINPVRFPNRSGGELCYCGANIHVHGLLDQQMVCPMDYIVESEYGVYACKPEVFGKYYEIRREDETEESI